ncbi:hypothetical protein [Ekhidna sp.]|uniref:hypothetical protein n=1 Tax=Ekhidna sp. TaxID=2608089 RepID=UPI003CCBF46C
MKSLKILSIFLLSAIITLPATGQQLKTGTTYKTAIGVRGLGTSGLTIKHFTEPSKAIEGIVGFYPNAFSATVLVERYAPAFSEPGLNWYYGIGGHVATQSDVIRNDGLYRRETSELGLGIDGIFGIEYKIQEVPIAMSLDFKPFFEVATDGDAFIALDPGLGIKVTF